MIVFLLTTSTTSFRRFTSVQHCAKQLIYIILFNSPKNPIRGRLFFIPLNIHMGFPGRSVVKINQIPYDYTVEVRNRFKGLDLIECLMSYGLRFVTLYRSGASPPGRGP